MFKFFGVSILAILLVSGLYFWYSQKRIEALVSFKVAVEHQNMVIEQQRKDLKIYNKQVKWLHGKFKLHNKAVSDLEDKFRKPGILGRRDLGKMALSQPGYIANIVNQGTDEVLRCLEIYSGDEIEKDDTGLDCVKEIEEDNAFDFSELFDDIIDR